MDVFEDGASRVLSVTIGEKGEECPPPKPLLVAAPSNPAPADGFPVLILFHGFCLSNLFYRQLMRHIASHGFIVVAPQMYRFAGPDASPEIEDAAAIISWVPGNLHRFLPADGVRADATKLAIAGHSRGGKVAFSLALGFSKRSLPSRVSALIALDPVDGTSSASQTNPPVLRYRKDSLQPNCPVLIIAAGYGGEKKNFLFPACAPRGVGPLAFFRDCCAPAFLLSAPEHGHFDFLDDATSGLKGGLTSLVGKNGKARKPMRIFTAGAIVAFLQAVFRSTAGGGGNRFEELLHDTNTAPVKLDPPEWNGEIHKI
ncbi:chlorophyllase-2, chloroplastic [Selaginella moellendorffii]|nr:chlorophyllase-2, chloroplastic [Selaginella moellendorffii]|eukprot:XP_002974826.2 chlorophyllase-2, chloroplastic [Selaginella moellendorffii]